MHSLNDQQRRAAEYGGKHLLVLAGAGTGKTRTIIARAEYLIHQGVPANRIAILSFTRKSAQEIAHRVKLAVAQGYEEATRASASTRNQPPSIAGRTFHSWCNEIIQRYPDYFPQSAYTLLDDDDQKSALGLALGQVSEEANAQTGGQANSKKLKDSQGKKLNSDSVLQIYSYAVNTLCSLSEAIRKIRYQHEFLDDKAIAKAVEKDRAMIAPIIQQYIEYKKARQYMDYDDLLRVVAFGLEGNEVIRRQVTGRWDHILVDEMQDTNPLQYKLLSSFAKDCRLFCVGDDAQSIYAFRGADFKTIHSFTDVVPDSEAYKLEINYRSTQEILDLSNWLLRESPLRYNKELKAFRGDGIRPELVHTFNEWEEADEITEDVLRTVEEGARLADSMVLGRSAWALAKVEGACLQKKIPYRKLGGTSLMKSAHVRDVVSALRVLINPFDEIAWIRFLKLWPGIGDVKAARIVEEIMGVEVRSGGDADAGGALGADADAESGGAVGAKSGGGSGRGSGRITLEAILPHLRANPHLQSLPSVANTLQVAGEFAAQPARAIHAALGSMENTLIKRYDDEWHYRKDDFLVLEEVAKSTGSLSEFITEYVLDPSVETTLKVGVAGDDDVLTLSTIHSAKGLEATNVHVVGVNPYSFPSARTMKEGEDAIEEERRCLYVALTRAKDVLKVYRSIKSLHAQPAGKKSQPADKKAQPMGRNSGAMGHESGDVGQKTEHVGQENAPGPSAKGQTANGAIQKRKTYRSKADPSREVSISDITDHHVEIFHTQRRYTEKIPYDEFLDDYEEATETAEELYFLNRLPQELVTIVVPGNDDYQPEKNLPPTDPASFPDFDFG